MGVAGSVYIAGGTYVSMYVYSSIKIAYSLQSESGWGCHYMGSGVGFHADAKTTEQFGKGWSLISKWEDHASVNPALYSLGGAVATNGFYHAPATGYYACSVQARLDKATKQSYFRLILALNGDKDRSGP